MESSPSKRLERASCQRGLAGRRLSGWPLLQLYTTTPGETTRRRKRWSGQQLCEAWLDSTNRRGCSLNSWPIATRIREHGEISGAQSRGFDGNPLS